MKEAKLTGDVRARVTDNVEDAVEKLAHDRSEPGDPTHGSDIVRDALEDYEPLQPYLEDEE